jgi:hypothetical protein
MQTIAPSRPRTSDNVARLVVSKIIGKFPHFVRCQRKKHNSAPQDRSKTGNFPEAVNQASQEVMTLTFCHELAIRLFIHKPFSEWSLDRNEEPWRVIRLAKNTSQTWFGCCLLPSRANNAPNDCGIKKSAQIESDKSSSVSFLWELHAKCHVTVQHQNLR